MIAPRRDLIAVALVVVAAFAVRFPDLDVRPMHSDEANQAVKLGELLDGHGYRFNPDDHHGPTLYFFAAAVARMSGEHSLAELTETVVRLTPVLFGTTNVLLVWWLARAFGRFAALAAALLAACSPLGVYYSRYFIQETLLATFFLAALGCGRKWMLAGSTRWAVATGVAAGCMLATKMSALVFGAAAALSLLVVTLLFRNASDARRSLDGKQSLLMGTVAVGIAALFYSSFGTNPAGAGDALRSVATMAERATGATTGHEKPAAYYLGLFFFQKVGGYFWDQSLFFVLALAGLAVAWRASRTGRVLALTTLLSFVALSAAPYKTPWQMVTPAALLCVMAGGALARLPGKAAAPLVVAVVGLLSWQTWQAAYFRPADQRNPYAYVHSSPDIKRARGIVARAPAGPVKVISREYWPLPWYLKQRGQVGYWSAAPEDCDAPVIFVDDANAGIVRSRLRGQYRSGLIGLRPGVILEVLERE